MKPSRSIDASSFLASKGAETHEEQKQALYGHVIFFFWIRPLNFLKKERMMSGIFCWFVDAFRFFFGGPMKSTLEDLEELTKKAGWFFSPVASFLFLFLLLCIGNQTRITVCPVCMLFVPKLQTSPHSFSFGTPDLWWPFHFNSWFRYRPPHTVVMQLIFRQIVQRWLEDEEHQAPTSP